MNTTYRQKLTALSLIVMVAATMLGAYFLKNNFDLRQQASTLTGTAQFTFQSQSGTTLKPGTVEAITISASGTGASNVDGFQLIANISGNVPAITVEPQTFSALNSVASTIVDANGGKKLTLAFITKDPQTPFNPNNAVVPLATLRFTVPASGTMSIAVDENYSKILQSVTGQNLLGVTPTAVFTFANPASPSPSPTTVASPIASPVVVVPTPTPVASPIASPIASPRVSPVASPIVVVTPSVSPSTRPVASPTPVVSMRPTPSPVVVKPSPTIPSTQIQCAMKNFKVVPYPDSTKWTTTGMFQVQNTGSSAQQFNWSLNTFSKTNLNQSGSKVLAPQQSITLGLGNICSRWSLNIGCGQSDTDRGYVVESNSAACIQATPKASTVPGSNSLPNPTPGSNGNFFQRLIDSFRNLFRR